MNLGYVVISYGNVTDTEPTALKEEFKAYTSRDGKPLKAGPPGEAPVSAVSRRDASLARALPVFSVGRRQAGKLLQAEDWVVNDFSELLLSSAWPWVVGLVCS